MIYLIEELILDPSENSYSNALYYKIIGYTTSIKLAENKITNGKLYSNKDCWAISENQLLSQYRYRKLTTLK